MSRTSEHILTVGDSHRFHREKSDAPLSLPVYCKVAHAFLKFLMSKALDGNEICLPANMGRIGVKGTRVQPTLDENGNITGLSPDWAATKKLWQECQECAEKKERIFHLNEHTNGVRYRIYWSSAKCILVNKSAYSLVFSRDNKRELSKRIKAGQEYYVYENE